MKKDIASKSKRAVTLTRYLLLIGIGTAVLAAAQTIDTSRLLLKEKLLTVVGGKESPKYPEYDMLVGANHVRFRTSAKSESVDNAQIEISKKSTVAVVFGGPPDSRAYLFLFTEDKEGKVVSFFDLDTDGVWDIKRQPTRNEKKQIWLHNTWQDVTSLGSLVAREPTAEKDGVVYLFREGSWSKIK